MKIRLPSELHKKLQHASECYGLSITDIGNRAMRKYKNNPVAIDELEKLATDSKLDNPITIRFEDYLIEGMSPDDVRDVLWWYLGLYPCKQETALYIDPDEEKAVRIAECKSQIAIATWQMELQGGLV